MKMKHFLCTVLLLVSALGAQAQSSTPFAQGTKYVGASVSGLGLSYSSNEKFRMGLDVNAGYFAADCLLLRASVGYDHTKAIDDVSVGAGVRYYFDQCGVFMGAGAEYDHFTPSNNDVMIPCEVGYSFFLNHNITLEPSVYYKMSLHDFSNNSTVGVKIGLGIYF